MDFVVGTSMGSIVGGLYAIGNSPAQIDQKFHEIQWTGLFADWPSQDWLSFHNKRDLERLIDVEFGASFEKGIKLPRGFIAGQKLGFELKKHTFPAAAVTDFNKFALPYRAVAADINTGEVVVHDHGNIADAIRSSMSIPGAFPPVEIDGRILVDGGIVNNVPVDVARKMGADVVIAIDVGTPLGSVTPDSSVLELLQPVPRRGHRGQRPQVQGHDHRAGPAHPPGARRHLLGELRPRPRGHGHRRAHGPGDGAADPEVLGLRGGVPGLPEETPHVPGGTARRGLRPGRGLQEGQPGTRQGADGHPAGVPDQPG